MTEQKSIPPLTKFLVPIDGSEPSLRAVSYAGCLASVLQDRIEAFTILHVLAGSYLTDHMKSVSQRAEHVLESRLFQELKEHHITEEVMPMMIKSRQDAERLAGVSPIDVSVLDGRPADVILEKAQTEGYSTIVIGRRGLSEMKEMFLGSVTSALLHQPEHPSIYVVGRQVLENEQCPLPRVLIPVDGSRCSSMAVEEAAILGQRFEAEIAQISLLRVIDLATYGEKIETDASAETDASRILEENKKILLDAGIPEHKIECLAPYGTPAKIILEVAEEKKVNLIVMGRRGRSSIKELILGSVSSEVLHRCDEPTVAIICGQE